MTVVVAEKVLLQVLAAVRAAVVADGVPATLMSAACSTVCLVLNLAVGLLGAAVVALALTAGVGAAAFVPLHAAAQD